MNKIVVSLGMAALGLSGIPAASAQESAPPSKLWNVTASLRGFYDDNINGAPSGPDKVDSFGFEVSPGLGLNWDADQTSVRLGYLYSLRYFEKERFGNEGHDSQSHTFNGTLNHRFSERYSLGVQDSFVIGQEPDQLRSQNVGGLPIGPVPGDNIRNYGSIVFNAAITPIFGLEAGYDNQWFDYDDSGGTAGSPSFSGLLDRIEQILRLEGQWHVSPQTTALFGYQYGRINDTADEVIDFPLTTYEESDDRNSRSHYVYGGVTHAFRPDLTGSLRAGARFSDFYNVGEDRVTPYLRTSLRYDYAAQSYLEAGGSYDFTAGGAVGSQGAETANIFGTLRHRITPKIFGSATALFQNSTYKGDAGIDGKTDQLYNLGLNLEYMFTAHLSSHIGYNFDSVDSEIGSDYNRNRVYIGVTARY
jgi:Putative beta-barrel porin 2